MKFLVPALFLDRDGVVNREVGYLYKPEQMEFLPGIFELCRSAQAMGYLLIVITNQAGIARELYSEADFHFLMRWMTEQFASVQIKLDGYYYCPHHPEHGIGRYRLDCPDRKPQPGMLLQAAREHRINLSQSLLIGDRCSDIQAGAAAGVGKLVLLAGTESTGCRVAANHTVVQTLEEVNGFLSRPSLHS
jgi:D-glycero-D-manno-heptose 1,7-bisphosphate phosphatase